MKINHSIIKIKTRRSVKNAYHFVAQIVFILIMGPLFLSCGSDTMEVSGIPENPPVSLNNPVDNGQNNMTDDELKESIAEILIDNGHTELLEAVEYVNAEIYTQLPELFASQSRQHTLFAPSNEAFFKLYSCLGMKTLDISELGDPGFVRDILLYHVARGVQDSNSILPSENENRIETLAGIDLIAKSDRSIQSIGSIATIGPDDADKRAKNGIVHVISEVLLPLEVSCQESSSTP